MKLFLIALTLLTSLSSFAGTAKCGLTEVWENLPLIVGEGTNLSCYDEVNEKAYFVTLRGAGIALKLPEQAKYSVTCPGKNDMIGSYYGVRASVNALYGANGGVFVGKGVCFVGGLGVTIGVSLEGARLKIQDSQAERETEEELLNH
jgi:hypothetical protein